MKPVDVSEVRDIAEYERIRPEWRARIMAMKERRRIGLGEHLTLLFENRETVLYQIQEMVRIERMVKAEEIAHEVATYNELIPAVGQLSATLMVEYADPGERDVQLRKLLGLENHLWLECARRRSQACFDGRQISPERLSSVQFLKFSLSRDQVARFAEGAKLVADHPCYRAEHILTAPELSALAHDLA
jgi:hypothetical protein